MLSDDKQDDAVSGSMQPKPLPVGEAPTAGKMSASTQVSRGFRGWRGWVLRIASLVVSPVLFCGLAEMALRLRLRLSDQFFLDRTNGDSTVPTFSSAGGSFPRQLAREPEPGRLSSRSPDTTRIFILGESAAMGMPNPAFSFGRILEVMLHERYPGCRFRSHQYGHDGDQFPRHSRDRSRLFIPGR